MVHSPKQGDETMIDIGSNTIYGRVDLTEHSTHKGKHSHKLPKVTKQEWGLKMSTLAYKCDSTLQLRPNFCLEPYQNPTSLLGSPLH